MTAGRFEPYPGAETPGPGEPEQRAENWDVSGTWEQAEAWNYDEARANPDAYDLLELRIMHDREQGPRFTRFQAAMADAPPVMAGLQMPLRLRPLAEAGWLDAVRTGRFWISALWLVGAAAAGMVTGLVSTNLVALAFNPAVSSVVADPLATPSAAARAALSAPAPSAVTALAQAAARPVPGSDQAVRSTPAASLASTPSGASLDLVPGAGLSALPPMPTGLQLAALVPAPGLAASAPATSIDRPAPPAAAAVNVPAARERASNPPAAASEARLATPLPAVVYRVQLARLRDKRNVKYVWRDFVAQFGASANGLERYVVPTSTARGIRHLVQVGPFADEGRAEAACNRLKQRGGDCLVVRQPS